jgi:DNA-binding transcriptional MerR regulator
MDDKGFLSISAFARLSGINRKNLIFYDEIGLFSPEAVGANRYRYYTYPQLQTANVIWALREIGVPLKEIKAFIDERTPEKLVAICGWETERIVGEIDKLRRIMSTLRSVTDATEEARRARIGAVETVRLEETLLFMGWQVDNSDPERISDALAEFYAYCMEQRVEHTYPYGSLTSRRDLVKSGLFPPSRFYCPPDDAVARELLTLRPAGLYVVGYDYGDYGKIGRLYRRLLRYIEKNGLRIAGDGYEDYLVNEIAVRNPDRYVARVMILVEARDE